MKLLTLALLFIPALAYGATWEANVDNVRREDGKFYIEYQILEDGKPVRHGEMEATLDTLSVTDRTGTKTVKTRLEDIVAKEAVEDVLPTIEVRSR